MNTLTEALESFIEQRQELKLSTLEKEFNKAFSLLSDDIEMIELQASYDANVNKWKERFNVNNWISGAARRAKQISFITHTPKFTHSKINKDTSAFLIEQYQVIPNYLTTSSIFNKRYDVVGSASALDVAAFLQIEFEGDSLITQITNGHINALLSLSTNAEQLIEWFDGFLLAFDKGEKELESHTQAKQVYFPISNDSDNSCINYLLVLPMQSTTLIQELHNAITKARFSEEQKEIRKLHRNKLHSEHERIDFVDIATLFVGGANPQNVSQLNSQRVGKLPLLNSAPPKFELQETPPFNQKNVFDGFLYNKVRNEIIAIKNTISCTAQGTPLFKHKVIYEDLIQRIISEVLSYAAMIQELKHCGGWSFDEQCQLPLNQSLWLDIYNPDPLFKENRSNNDWVESVIADFNKWIKSALSLKDDRFNDLEDMILKLFKTELKQFERYTKVTA